MILVDISSILHRMIFGSTKDVTNIREKDGKYITEDFINLTLYNIFSELINIQIDYQDYGEMIICFDDYKKRNWRRDVYPLYKQNRKVLRDTNKVNYNEVFNHSNELFENIQKYTPWKCIQVNRAEADDVILVLAKEFYQEGVLILSPDKDFIQAQRLPNVKQFSPLTKKWIEPETKHNDMNGWIYEHVLLGDVSDGVPKVVDHTEFSDNFKENLISKNLPTSVKTFKELPNIKEIISEYNVKLHNRKGEEIGLDIYKPIRFGPADVKKILNGKYQFKREKEKLQNEVKSLRELKKISDNKTEIQSKIKEIQNKIKNLKIEEKTVDERLNEFLDSHELYREHYERNYILVMEEGIPDYIRVNIIMEYKNSKTDYNEEKLCEYLRNKNLGGIISKLPRVFQSNTKLDITNCGWV